jgi:hypothetical protein
LRNWIPFKLFFENNQHLCQWLFIGTKEFTEPFFDETIVRSKALAENKHFYKPVSTLDMLRPYSSDVEAIAPTAFIFHVSRCGSTLLSQVLAMDETNIVLSEVPFFDEMLRLPYKYPGEFTFEESNDLFKSSLQFYAQKKNAQESALFVKADSWHLLFYDRLREMYPDTPFIILYRSPAEVIRSHNMSRGMQSVPGLIEYPIFGFTEAAFTPDLDLYMSRVLEKYFLEIHRITKTDSNYLLLNYNDGMLKVIKEAFSFLGKRITPDFEERINERLRYHGKQRGFFFTEEEPIRNAAPYLKECISLYQQLEEKRLSPGTVFNKVEQ